MIASVFALVDVVVALQALETLLFWIVMLFEGKQLKSCARESLSLWWRTQDGWSVVKLRPTMDVFFSTSGI